MQTTRLPSISLNHFALVQHFFQNQDPQWILSNQTFCFNIDQKISEGMAYTLLHEAYVSITYVYAMCVLGHKEKCESVQKA